MQCDKSWCKPLGGKFTCLIGLIIFFCKTAILLSIRSLGQLFYCFDVCIALSVSYCVMFVFYLFFNLSLVICKEVTNIHLLYGFPLLVIVSLLLCYLLWKIVFFGILPRFLLDFCLDWSYNVLIVICLVFHIVHPFVFNFSYL